MVRREQVDRPERTRGRTGDLVACFANFRNVGRMRSGRKGRMLDRNSLPVLVHPRILSILVLSMFLVHPPIPLILVQPRLLEKLSGNATAS
ncbi:MULTISPECIES: hypothetical protein [unclassified Sphingobacterium]|uniref:hypothetical protein n=1 Tax=unclassified Sphingobacterium TaxID=2609468 RepID=UPI0020C576C5|nr:MULTISPECIES: hypothetical protein [unclassified Sphingobacterium]